MVSATESSSTSLRKSKSDPRNFPLFLNDESDPAVLLNIDDAREAYKLILERPPKILHMEGMLSHLIRKQLIVTLRKFFRIYPLPSSDSNRDPYMSLLEDVNPSPGGEADKLQLRLVNLFATIYACPLVTDPLHFEVGFLFSFESSSSGQVDPYT